MKKWCISGLVFILVFIPLAILGFIAVFLFFGPHSGNPSIFMVAVIVVAVFALPLFLASKVFKGSQ